MIRTEVTKTGTPKVVFKGSTAELKQDFKRIMWSMIQKDAESRSALISAIDEINSAVKEMGV